MSGLKGFDIRDLDIGSWPPDPGMNTGSVKHAMVLFLNLALLTPPGVKRCVERAVQLLLFVCSIGATHTLYLPIRLG